jgi:hypothetical protein
MFREHLLACFFVFFGAHSFFRGTLGTLEQCLQNNGLREKNWNNAWNIMEQ